MIGNDELLEPAMRIQTKEEASAYLDTLIQQQVADGVHVEIATKIIKANLAYYAAYGSSERRARVERLFECEHPVFGAFKDNGRPTTLEAFTLGVNRGKGEGPQTLTDLRKITYQ